MRLNEKMAGDRVVRAMSDDGAFRTMVARTTETVRGVLAAQKVEGEAAQVLADMVTGVVLYRETMAPTLRVQGVVKGTRGSGQIIADSHPSGWVRGLVQRKADAPPFHLGSDSLLQLMRSLPSGDLQQGLVEMKGGVSEGMMSYMQQSEQIVTVVRVRTILDEYQVVSAGGYLVQLLPEAPDREGAIDTMATRLESDFANIDAWLEGGAEPNGFLERLYEGMPFTMLGDSALRFGCDCSKVRVLTSLSTLGVADLEELLSDGKALEMGCDWCGAEYRVEPEELKGLLSES
ncbi:MAG: Hsp33 family molecular chaperone HslO [Myxococcota bacterium]